MTQFATPQECVVGRETQKAVTPHGLTLAIAAGGSGPTPISGYVAGHSIYILESDDSSLNQFDIDANVTEVTWESMGPSSSGANNEWSGFDDAADAGARILILTFQYTGTTGAGDDVNVKIRNEGASHNGRSILRMQRPGYSGSGSETYQTENVFVPVDADGIFELFWSSSPVSPGLTMWMRGFIV